jgi:hypothetical protein
MIEERDANPTADTPARFRGRRAPTPLTARGTESSEAVARLSGTESSNPLPSRRESAANLTAAGRRSEREAHVLKQRSESGVAQFRAMLPHVSQQISGPDWWITKVPQLSIGGGARNLLHAGSRCWV